MLIDVDHGAGTGHAALAGALADTSGVADAILSASSLDAPAVTGFGADLALAVFGGADPHLEVLLDTAGLRGLRAPFGQPGDLGWHGVALNFGENVRARDTELTPTAGEGLEAFIPWERLYPELAGTVPAGATISLAAVLVNNDGGYTSNQALPPFPAGTADPGRTLTAERAVLPSRCAGRDPASLPRACAAPGRRPAPGARGRAGAPHSRQ